MATPFSSISLTCLLYVSLVLLCLLCSLKKGHADEGNDETIKNNLHTHNVKVNSLLPSDTCQHSSKGFNKSASLPVLHKYGPCITQANQDTAANAPSLIEILRQDQFRVDSIHARLALSMNNGHGVFKQMEATKVPVQSGAAFGTGNYVVTVGLGTPKNKLTLAFDTGSDITWTQCEPCLGSCYRQKEPKFDPTKSTSYKNVSCSSSACSLIAREGSRSGCSSSTCLYMVQYADNSYTVGFLATETLTISSSDVFKNFIFGCGQKNAGLFGQEAGLLGLGRSKLSLASQTANKYKKLFSYCIPSSSTSTGYLSFGGQVSRTVEFTPLSKESQDSPFYGIDITSISVGGRLLSVDASVYKKTGTIIDSGTVITRLPQTVYLALSSAFQELMKDYPMTDEISIFDTCYDFSEYETVMIPKISVVFQGRVEVDIHVSGIMIPVNGLEHVCLAFAGNGDDSDSAIFGNAQQRTYEVVHDNAKGSVGFAPNGCS